MSSTWSTSTKGFLILGSGVAFSICAYSAFKYWQKNAANSVDEGFEDVSKNEEKRKHARILILGLDNAGKSTLMAQILNQSPDYYETPTEGSRVSIAPLGDITYSIWEVGGGQKYRKTWVNFLEDTDLLIFVVDSADSKRFALASRELKNIMADERLHETPLMVVANKQDLPNAVDRQRLFNILDLSSLCERHHTNCVPMRTLPGSGKPHPDLERIKHAIADMIR